MLKSHILCMFLTVCGLSFALATISGEVAEISGGLAGFLHTRGKFGPVYAAIWSLVLKRSCANFGRS